MASKKIPRPRKPARAKKLPSSAHLYREMVAAVRRWVAVACPDDFADRLTLSREAGDDIRHLAYFHSGPDSPWTRGDLLAEGGPR